MSDAPLLQFESLAGGHRAQVRILTSRLEWSVDGRPRVIEMVPVTSISSVHVDNGDESSARLIVEALGGPSEFVLDAPTGERAAAMLTELVAAARAAQQLRPELGLQRPHGEGSTADELATLQWLLDTGILSPADFETQRARLLRR